MSEDNQTSVGEEFQTEQLGPVFSGPGAKHDKRPFKLPRLSSSQYDAVQKAKKYAMEQNIKTVLVKQTIAHQQQQMQSMQNALQKQQAWSLMCRIYVGSINFEIKEDTVQQAFLPFGPMKSFHLAYDQQANKHKGFAFIEYETPEAASLALEQMNGVVLGGRNIKVGRPSNMPQAQAIIESYLLEAQQYHRIYIASVHPDLTESDLKCVFEAFGKIRTCRLPRDTTRAGKHKGYAFIEYENSQSASDAVSAMNLFDLGGQYIRVGRAVTPPNVNLGPTTTAPMPTATAVAAAAITAKITALDAANQSYINDPSVIALQVSSPFIVQPGTIVSVPVFTSVPMVTATITLPDVVLGTMPPATPVSDPVLVTSSSNSPEKLLPHSNEDDIGISQEIQSQQSESSIVVLHNMVDKEDIDDDLEDEIREECGKYGEVLGVVVKIEQRQPDSKDTGDTEDEEITDSVKIFVEFSSVSASSKAISSLNGRFFAGRQIIAEFHRQS